MSKYELPVGLEKLGEYSRWAVYRLEPRKDGSMGKPPYSPTTGKRASSTDPTTWGTYEAAVTTYQNSNGFFAGIGFMMGGGFMGIDLDHVIDPAGRLDPAAERIVGMMDCYTEYSPSGTGLHFVCLGTKPGERCKAKLGEGKDIEMYDNARFLTITGKHYGQPRTVAERTQQAAAVYAAYIERESPAPAPAPQNAPTERATVQQDRTDAEIIQRAISAANGSRFAALWSGDLSAYNGDHSRADQAFCNDLAYWTNGDRQRMDGLFRQSGLMREKWDERRGAKTYGEITLDSALARFQPYTRPTAASEFAGIGTAAPAPTGTAASGYSPSQQGAYPQPVYHDSPTESNPQPDNVTAYIDGFFDKDVERFISFKDRKTGFKQLDDQIGGLYPGLYVLGAISSLGKTTFIHQIGDNLAAAGNHVLFFSLEQSRLEMTLKSIARTTAQLNPMTATSAISIRSGYRSEAISAARRAYSSSVGARMNVIEGNFAFSVEAMGDYVRQYIKQNGVKPVVIIDYLQIVKIDAGSTRDDPRNRVDYVVSYLKKLQSENDLLCFVVSSVNRTSYLQSMDFESFKESGGIEYTSDVVWGLQLAVMDNPIFEKEKAIEKKRKALKEAKKAIPRIVELVCLKNRYGVSSYSCFFNYDPRYDLFTCRDMDDPANAILLPGSQSDSE